MKHIEESKLTMVGSYNAQVLGFHCFIDYLSLRLQMDLKVKWTKKIDIFPFVVLPLPEKQ